MRAWRLKKNETARFAMGHPWVYSNELQESPKGIEPGEEVEIQDAGGGFLARGYGNPASLIAFRAMTRIPEETEPLATPSILARLRAAERLRSRLGLAESTHRLSFGEADGLPGLIVDRYRLDEGERVFSVQAHTAGMNRVLPRIFEALGELDPDASILLRNDLGVRKLEGLEEEEPRVIRGKRDSWRVRARVPGGSLACDLLAGQKTGLFLDQVANQVRLAELATQAFPSGEVRILDLFSYVGAWGAALTRALGSRARVTAIDSSAAALNLAQENIRGVDTRRMDVLAESSRLESASYDIVVADPPALIPSRKHVEAGCAAYSKVAEEVLRVAKPGALIAFSSCSRLLTEDRFQSILSRAERRSRRAEPKRDRWTPPIAWIAQGGQAPDHPTTPSFSEGRYLKAAFGIKTEAAPIPDTR